MQWLVVSRFNPVTREWEPVAAFRAPLDQESFLDYWNTLEPNSYRAEPETVGAL